MSAADFSDAVGVIGELCRQIETVHRVIRAKAGQDDEIVDLVDVVMNISDHLVSVAEGALREAMKMQPTAPQIVQHDHPTPAQRAAECAAQTLANMERVEGLAAVFEAIESAVVGGKSASVMKLAALGRSTAGVWVSQLSEVHLISIRAAGGAA